MQKKKKYSKQILLIKNNNLEEIKNKIQNIVQLANTTPYLIYTDYILDNRTLTITTDFMSSCEDLKAPISTEQIKSVIKDVVIGLEVLEKANYYHGSIKLSNILYDKNNFVLCHYYLREITDSNIPNIETLEFQSPEALKSDELSIKSDMWSLGCVIYYLYYNVYAFKYTGSLKELTNKIINNERNIYSKNKEKDRIINDLIDNLITTDVNKRYNLKTVNNKLRITNNTEIYEKKNIVYLKCNKYVTDFKYMQNGVFYHIRCINFINAVLLLNIYNLSV